MSVERVSTTYKVFGIPLFTIVTMKSVEHDEEAMYKRFTDRFSAEMADAVKRVQGAK